MPALLNDMLIGPYSNLARTAIVGVLAYCGLVLVLRASGKRTLSKLSAFDLVVTVALGSCLATILLSSGTSLLQGLLAYAVLVGMQFLVAWGSTRSKRLGKLVKAQPALVFYRGEVLRDALRRERLTVAELAAAARSAGLDRMESADAIVLESDGSLSVLRKGAQELSLLRDVDAPTTLMVRADSEFYKYLQDIAPRRR
jgi:uncharacterized membrane protein YcaP (DUF421 family)